MGSAFIGMEMRKRSGVILIISEMTLTLLTAMVIKSSIKTESSKLSESSKRMGWLHSDKWLAGTCSTLPKVKTRVMGGGGDQFCLTKSTWEGHGQFTVNMKYTVNGFINMLDSIIIWYYDWSLDTSRKNGNIQRKNATLRSNHVGGQWNVLLWSNQEIINNTQN